MAPLSERVKRWDIYDIADELADVPGMISAVFDHPNELGTRLALAVVKIRDLERRLWQAAEQGGEVGPAPDYQQDPTFAQWVAELKRGVT